MDSLKGRNDKPYLLDSSVQSDDPLSIYKSLWQILYENSTWILILVGVVLATIIFLFCKKKKKAEEPKQPAEITIDPYEEALQAIQELQANKHKYSLNLLFLDFLKFSGFMYKDASKMLAMELTGEEFIVEIVSNPFSVEIMKNCYVSLSILVIG